MVAAALFLGACGNPDVCSCALYVPPTPVPTLQPGFAVLITEHERAVAVQTGQKIELFLRARSGMSDWRGVNVDDQNVLHAVPTGITAIKGVTIAGFVAIAPGTAKITATATPICSPGQACPQYAMLFEVTVTVTAG